MARRNRIFLNFMNNLVSFLGDFFSLTNDRFFGTKTSKIELPSGVIIKITSAKNGGIRSFSLLRNQSVFERMNWDDTLYSVSFEAEKGWSYPGTSKAGWDDIREFCNQASKTKLPAGWKYNSAIGRIWFWSDGEVFSIPIDEVARIDNVLERYRIKNNINE